MFGIDAKFLISGVVRDSVDGYRYWVDLLYSGSCTIVTCRCYHTR